jgi:hypothetical protein
MVSATRLDKVGCKLINGCNGMYFMTLVLKGFDQAHPEIMNVPGGVQHHGNPHR